RSAKRRRREGAPRAPSGLLPDFRGAAHSGRAPGISRSGPRLDSSRQRGRRNRGLPGHDRAGHRDHRRGRHACHCGRANRWMDPVHSRDARDNPRDGCGGCDRQSGSHDFHRSRYHSRLELHDGVPPSLRTMVVMPTLLTTRDEIDEQIERLEVHYLASSDGELYFAILSDWTDSATETTPADDDLLGAAAAGIARLNQRHGQGPGGKRFLLLHRRRVWDEAEGVWMGWERKRGKLHELNRLLRGATDTTFIASDGHPP